MAKIYKKQGVEADVWQLALERTEYCYRTYDHVGVFFSGGKDSTVVLHAALEVATHLKKLPVHVVHYDEEAISPETVEYVGRVADRDDVKLDWLCLPIKHRNACSRRSPWWYPWAPEDKELWVRPLPDRAITELAGFTRRPHNELEGIVLPPRHGRTCAIMGIRTDESLNRYMAIAANKTGRDAYLSGHPNYRHIAKAYTIYDWAWDDVWLAPSRFNWDYNRAYDMMSKAGIPPSKQRLAPPFGEQPMEHLWKFAICWPDLWAKMVDRVPGAATGGRYCNTELYGGTAKPDGMSWRDFVFAVLDKMPAADRATTAKSLNTVIAHHRAQTRRPLPDDVKDPDSGLCWADLGGLAARGDLKGRIVISLLYKANTTKTNKGKRSRHAK